MRCLINRICEQPALIKSHITRRRPYQTAHSMALHIFRHIKAHQLYTQRFCQLLCHFCFAHTCRAGEQVIPNRLFRLSQAST